ncbi:MULTISPECIES: winged helix-turn-helix transcriptional regulator [Streptomyces]|uniref:Helix-turn-helix domain-containing protein n=2 Tax=Streptomyces caniscabiei TaxID=2746961 RepID=A0ABU4N4T7_9ACTN|nr:MULTISPECIES: helix-turn-helix domain-containing protein [Streptomyces]MBE4741914.1 helix-turn-helix transcriptional regulator [Streptomyces caniscabiei]MBE4762646.1 helix-turn-helix transcriptional regulator [Streptomyces caniscabiei]MBE4775904.1 helix-turn-helix transcriptional regulator [Streptomyces caniscabiei]MBE4790740.1 helix-turn-helix transcriptional regulator [Streptomyces caniscabiei]MBE4799904.1 helix-turn-helix transcriptional regulator [Streptomyces caniscabiei]
MLGRMYDSQLCSIARTLEVVGERWTLLIIRDAQLGLRRFEEFQDSLGIARNVLTNRLSKLVDDGLLERVCYQERPARYEYRPTDKARDLLTALLGLMHWGDEHAAHPAGPPRVANHVGCGGDVREQLVCTDCGHVVGPDAVDLLPGPALIDQPA